MKVEHTSVEDFAVNKQIEEIVKDTKENSNCIVDAVIKVKEKFGYTLERSNILVDAFWYDKSSHSSLSLSEKYEISHKIVSQYFSSRDSISAARKVHRTTGFSLMASISIVSMLWEELANGSNQIDDSINDDITKLLEEGQHVINISAWITTKYSLSLKEAFKYIEPLVK